MVGNNKNIYIFLLITFPIYPVSCKKPLLGKVIDSISESTCMDLINKKIYAPATAPTFRFMLGNIEASIEYQLLGKDVQSAIGLSPSKQLPIKKIPTTSPLYTLVGALAQPDAIYVNEEKLNERPYGARRCALLHEAIHARYNDMATHDILSDLGWIVSSFVTYKSLRWIYPQQRKVVLGLVAVGGNYALAFLLGMQHKYYIERRADIEGHYASECFICVQEAAEQRRISFEEQNNPLRYQGYLWAAELTTIAQELEQQHKICDYHRSSHSADFSA